MRREIGVEVLDELKVGESVWDTEQIGFGARRRKGGVFFVFKVQRRGHAEWVSLGRLGDITLKGAREKAAQERAIVAAGGRPGAWRAVPTLKEFAKRYLNELASRAKPRTIINRELNLRLHLLPALGHRRLDEIEAHDVERLKQKMRKKPGAFNVARETLTVVLNAAMRLEVLPERRNPCRHVSPYALPTHQRFLSEQELSRLGTALAELEAKGADSLSVETARLVAAAVRLLVFTGARRDEIRYLKWDEVGSGALPARTSQLEDDGALRPPECGSATGCELGGREQDRDCLEPGILETEDWPGL